MTRHRGYEGTKGRKPPTSLQIPKMLPREATMTDDQFAKVIEILDEHHDRMEGGDQAHRELMARVARCEARLDGRGQDVAERDLTPAEAMDAMAELVRDPASLEDTEGLEVVAYVSEKEDMGMPRRDFAWAPATEEDVIDGWLDTPLVRLSDALDEIRVMRDANLMQDEAIDRLTARLEEVERERGEWEGRSMVATRQRDEWKAHWRGRLDELTALTTENHTLRQRLEEAERERDAAEAWQEIIGLVKDALALHYGAEHMERVPPMMYDDAIRRLVHDHKDVCGERDTLRQRLEGVERERDEESRAAYDLAGERDELSDVVDALVSAVWRPKPEWSSCYDYSHAVEDVQDRVAEIEAEANTLRQRLEGMVVTVDRETVVEAIQYMQEVLDGAEVDDERLVFGVLARLGLTLTEGENDD